MANDLDLWNDLEELDQRTKEYKQKLKEYSLKYIEVEGSNSLK
jgi:hypothetical protein